MTTPRPPIFVTVVTGFLGAGKSTLVEAWLSQMPRDEVAVIVNERGEIGIDGELLAGHVARLREITGGCVCCTSQAELAVALRELVEGEAPPARILVETSGAASPAGVIRAIARGAEHMRLDGVISVLDASRASRTLAFDLAVEQLGFADVVVLSHVDRCGDLGEVEPLIGAHAPAAVIAESPPAPGFADLLEARRDTLRLPPKERAHAVIEAVSLHHEGALDEGRFGAWMEEGLGAVEARILRLKGILAIDGVDARVIVQGVSESVEVVLGTPWGDAPRTSRLVVLGLGLDADALEAGFAACAHRP